MSNRPHLPEAIARGRVLAIFRGLEPRQVIPLAEALASEGIGAVEITADSPDAWGRIAALRRELPDLETGCGTVLDTTVATRAADAGAAFLVTPHTDTDLIGWAAKQNLPMLAGAYTPSEVVAAHRAGAAAVKLFPAAFGGPAYLRALREPLRHVPLVPTGGVDGDNAGAFLEAGAVAVALGGWLASGGDPDTAAQRARRLVAAIEEVAS